MLARDCWRVRLSAVRVKVLTQYEIAADGTSCRLCFVDGDGAQRALEVPLSCLQQLLLTMPTMTCEALRNLHRNDSLELVHVVESWSVRSATNQRVIFSFTTPDGYSVSFNIASADLGELAEAAIEYEVEAYPEGLAFPRHQH